MIGSTRAIRFARSMCLLRHWICAIWALKGSILQRPAGRRTILRRCSSSTFTAISTGSREAGRNLEVMWLTGRLAPDHKTIADFRKDNGPAIKKACAIRRVVPQDGPAGEGQRCHRQQQVQTRLDQNPQAMRVRRETVEHPFATLKM